MCGGEGGEALLSLLLLVLPICARRMAARTAPVERLEGSWGNVGVEDGADCEVRDGEGCRLRGALASFMSVARLRRARRLTTFSADDFWFLWGNTLRMRKAEACLAAHSSCLWAQSDFVRMVDKRL